MDTQATTEGYPSIGAMVEWDEDIGHSVYLRMSSTGFPRGLQAEKILSVFTNANGTRMFNIKFKDSPKVEQLAACEANKRIPHMVIEFYWDHLSLSPKSASGKP
ncbi:heterochromatin protein 1 [Drosophila erecta]|uniref:Heterochromatin protein 1L chromoshadow domain n=1 Tax=Drosophila erecta TaxID=7220 RepID=B3NPB1_DROER|nr:heterochromatin protein 1 [Drosophila erecta]EDV56774.1 heterochromatin protein 1L chromoshadow domain [Drosophila erecta]